MTASASSARLLPHTASQWRGAIEAAYHKALTVTQGHIATYIPELAQANPDHFAIAAATADGEVVSIGDDGVAFTMQSICKPFLFAAALNEFGREEVLDFVGVEPLGEAFNSFVRLDHHRQRPHNPMINAGAIVISSLLARGKDVGWLLDFLSHFAQRTLSIDMATYLSEEATGSRNRAIAYLLRYFKRLPCEVEATLDFYFQACSVAVTVRDLAMMAATLANRGVHPLTNATLLAPEVLRDVLTVVTTCGLYDGAGRFAFEIGMPAKSGVAGGILAVVPGEAGLATFAPPLNEQGNSARGVEAMRAISSASGLHFLRPHAPSRRSTIIKPAADDLDRQLALALESARAVPCGKVADYVPQLARVNPELLSLTVVDVHGREWSVGDGDVGFSIQAAANPFAYAWQLHEHGLDAVHAKVGMEPSGNPFDAITLEPVSNRPFNPLSNSGAIAVASMAQGSGKSGRLKAMQAWFSGLAGEGLRIDAALCQGEDLTGDRNRAIAHLLHNYGVVEDVEGALSLYFQQCSVMVTSRILARMAVVLASGGKGPTGGSLLGAGVCQSVLSMMYMAGMHDQSGRFAFEVRIPAKSGVSGGIVAVVPGRYGIGVYGPGVDQHGTSVRGAAALKSLARGLGLGVFDAF